MMFRYVSIFIFSLILLTSCGSDGSSTSVASTPTPTSTPSSTEDLVATPMPVPSATVAPTSEENLTKTVGHLIDSPVEGVNYVCADGSGGLTDANGTFECVQAPITFKVGGLTLGVLKKFTTDGKVYLQDLLGLKRLTYGDGSLKLLARLIQSLDDDGKIKDKITITQSVRDALSKEQNFKGMKEREVEVLLSGIGKSFVPECGALAHLGNSEVNCNRNGGYYVYVNSVGRPTATVIPPITVNPTKKGFKISKPQGNTASYNAIAEFDVALASKPSSDVTIPVSSSDEEEGLPMVSNLTFTPNNWNQPQSVVVKGRNRNVVNGEQDYKIILASAQSSDSAYNGLDPDDVDMKGIVLELGNPSDSSNFIAGLEKTIDMNVTYTGNNRLSYTFLEKPDGMTIELNSGTITWTAPELAEGNSYNVKVRVTDGSRFVEHSFSVSVASATPLQTQTNGNVISVTKENSNLNGFKFRFLGDSPNLPIIKSINPNTLVESPSSDITRLSDYFYADESNEGDIDILMPISILPNLNDSARLVIYHYTEEYGWSAFADNLRVEEIDNIKYIVLSTGSLKGVMFIGLIPTAIGSSLSNTFSQKLHKRTANPLNILTANVLCLPVQPPVPLVASHVKQICTINSIPNTKFIVMGFGNANGRLNMWNPATSIEEMMVWVGESRSEFDNLGIGTTDRNITITLDGANGNYGYVDPDDPFEKGNTLHLSNRNNSKVTRMKASVAHEYFHHAQVKTILSGAGNNFAKPKINSEFLWLAEGTAMWFEDYLYDNLDDYTKYLSNPLDIILEKGLTSVDYRYEVDLFWKLISEKCDNFETNIKDIFYADFTNDLTRIDNVQTVLNNSSCNFGDQLGTNKQSSLELALLYYQYATLYRNKISLLDSNEDDSKFKFKPTEHDFSRPWLDTIAEWLDLDDNIEYKLNELNRIPTSGAFSFYTKEIQGELPEGKIAVLNIESSSDVIVSIITDEEFDNGGNTIGEGNDKRNHKWFKYSDSSNFIYEFSGKVPKLFVSLINPSSTTTIENIKVTFEITDEVNHDITITSHENNDSVNNRVVQISGTVPINDIEGGIDIIKVINLGSTTTTTVDSSGHFQINAVVAINKNILKFQGFKQKEDRSYKAVTKVKQLKLIGVENITGGQNALIPSRVVYVLQWKTNGTDIDIYSTDKNGATIWYRNESVTPGILDFDNTSGYGPEVISYRHNNSDVYVNGIFDVDVHFFSGSTSTAYSIDVITNEMDASHRDIKHYESKVSLPSGNSSENGANGSGNSRFNNILKVGCDRQRVCSLSYFSPRKLELK